MVKKEMVKVITRFKEKRGMMMGMVVRADTKNKLHNEAKEK